MRTRIASTVVAIAGVCGLALASTPAPAGISTKADDVARIQASERVFHDFAQGAGKSVAESVLVGGSCVAIVPGNKNFALGLGGIYGKGIATCRDNNGRWSAPIFITVGGISTGFQIGGESADLVLVFRDVAGLESMLNNKIRLGVQASAAAGPVGRQAEASTDAALHSQVLAYGKSRGLYAGVNVNGAVVQTDESGNRAMYGHAYWQDVLAGKVAPPPEAHVLLASLDASPLTNPARLRQAGNAGAPGAAAQPAGQAVGQAAKSAFGPPTHPLLHWSAGIGYVHQRDTPGLNGFDLNVGVRPWEAKIPGLKVVADFSRVKGSTALLGVSAKDSQWTYLVGPEFDVPRALFTPYGHLLFGGGHLHTDTTTSTGTTSASSDSFAWEAGAGLRLTPARYFNVQLVELDLLHTSFNNNGSSHFRIGIGVGFQF